MRYLTFWVYYAALRGQSWVQEGCYPFLNSLLVCLYSYLATPNCLTFRKQTRFHLLFPVFDGILVHGLNLVADEIEEQMTESALPLIAMAHHVFLQKL